MKFSAIAEVFDKLESTASRLEMTSILAEFFKTLEPEDIKPIIYLTQGKIAPDFAGVELGMADRLVAKAIAFTVGETESSISEMMIKLGDPGTVAEKLIADKKQMTLFSETLTLGRVISSLTAIAQTEGRDSQGRKMKYLSNMLHDSDPVEARYLCRIVTGRMRTGVAAMTVLDALALSFADKDARPEIERAYNVTSDLGLVGATLAGHGMAGISKIRVKLGNPIRVMLAERLPSLAHILEKMGGECAMEYKYDGIRVQAHIGPDGVKLYSRRLEDLTSNFPDIAESLKSRLNGKDAIIEGECVAIDKEGKMMPFQTVTHRRRKHGMDDAVNDYPVNIFMFDILYLNGKDLTNLPYTERRKLLSDSFSISGKIGLTTMMLVSGPEEAETFFEDALRTRCEGIIAKSIGRESVYRAGSRGFLWIKYKKDYSTNLMDSFDLVVVGAFYGMGKRAGKYGALLMAAFNHDTGMYSTVCKLGTGFDDAFLDELPEMLDPYKSEKRPLSVDSKMVPDVWFEPTLVLEVTGAEISVSPIHTAASGIEGEDSGIAIRFPRFTGRVRNDRGPDQATTVEEIEEMYRLQPGKSEFGDAKDL
ncbi:MAG: ATP-dependent DNA ligase [Candidatus Methanomethylophilaceae archaeon]|nr:ATP-dependent DNA ligase [Candidatus Methanomethylophilaceae archaeon]MDD3127896.1 ATP-dependent DNA ligase [Candidatus Methanomethylophilaceae archaeon]MDD4119547.1 ATP-dependent DNA ligase [Candidatus Methanomethylophilaceae archaeon]MDD4454711.1 ATP-dependent DNA ligase [Candidatus Methanomethylophilaceae archaeon]